MAIDWETSRVLVTGAAGFGGAHLCRELTRRKARVHGLDRWTPANSYLVLENLLGQVEMFSGDVRDGRLLGYLIERFEINTVFHLAAQPLVPMSNKLPLETLDINVNGTYAVLEAVRTCPRVERLVVASSGAYYGTTRAEAPLLEAESPGRLTNVYAASKVAADVAVRCYAEVYGVPAAVLRFMNTYGPGDTNFTRIVPRAIANLIQGDPYDFGDRDDGTTRLDFLHIRDMTQAYMAVADNMDSVAGEALNVGTGQPVALDELARLVSCVFDGKSRQPRFSGVAQTNPLCKQLDTNKLMRATDWRPKVSLEAGLTETIDWYRTHWTVL